MSAGDCICRKPAGVRYLHREPPPRHQNPKCPRHGLNVARAATAASTSPDVERAKACVAAARRVFEGGNPAGVRDLDDAYRALAGPGWEWDPFAYKYRRGAS